MQCKTYSMVKLFLSTSQKSHLYRSDIFSNCTFLILSVLAVALGNKCHVSDGMDSLGCGNATSMDCSGTAFTPYCHKTSDSATGMNGVCTCERCKYIYQSTVAYAERN